jgi:cell division septation protein DedD
VGAAPAKLAATGAPALKPAPAKPAVAVALAPKPRPAAAVTGGIWRVQLGAFGVAANAAALWARASARPELAGHRRIDVPTGKVSKLQAGGFASPGAAASACAGLTRAGFTCLVTQD